MSKSNEETMSRTKNKKNKSKRKNKKKNLTKKILLFFTAVIVAIGLSGAGLFIYYAVKAPELTNEDLTGIYAAEFVDMNGDVFYKLGAEEREHASADEYPEVMLDAIKAIEDQRFDTHIGIDPIGIGRAAWGYLSNKGQIVGGGSTITQQLIKLSVFSTLKEDQTLERKAQEAWLALQLERNLSKEQIITLYLNKVHMGGNVVGVATAAQEYYGKHISEIELHEAAMLAAIPNGPNYYSPYNNPEIAQKRRDLVLNEMVEYGVITKEDASEAKKIPVTDGLIEQVEDENNLVFDAYLTAAIKEVEEKTDYSPYTSGLTIYTNYDPNAQQILYDVANTDDYVNFPNDRLQTAASLIDSTTGKITALIGGRKLEGQLSENRAIKLQNSVGSTIKPLTVYGPAIEYEKFSTYHQIVDEPYSVGDWQPRNYDRSYRGQISMREALVDSRNIPAAKIFNEDLNQEQVSEFLTNLGINVNKISPGSDGLVPSSAFNGTMTPLELAGAYTAFANEGNYTEPYTVNKIVNQRGEETDLTPKTTKAMEDYTAYMVTDMLKGVINYYSSQLTIPGYVHAAKTGTTNYTAEEMAEANIPQGGVPDNWVVGYSPYYTMSVWVGYDEARKEGNYLSSQDGSIRLARDIYRESIKPLVQDLERRDWQRPSSVVEQSIEKGSNPAMLAPSGSKNAISELFVKGTEPSETAEPEFELSAPTGLNASYDEESDSINILWDAYKLPENVDGDIEYVLTINGEEHIVTEENYVLNNPPREKIEIKVAVKLSDEVGPSASTTIEIAEPEEDDTEEEEEETENSDEESEDENESDEDNTENEEDKEDEPEEEVNNEDETED